MQFFTKLCNTIQKLVLPKGKQKSKKKPECDQDFRPDYKFPGNIGERGMCNILQPLMKVIEESEKVELKFSSQKTKIMASGPITSWEIDGETVETDFIFLGSKITADSDCSHKIKRRLLLGRKVMTNLDSILKAETLLCQQRSI